MCENLEFYEREDKKIMVAINTITGEINGDPDDVIGLMTHLDLLQNDKDYKKKHEELTRKKMQIALLEASRNLMKMLRESDEPDYEAECEEPDEEEL